MRAIIAVIALTLASCTTAEKDDAFFIACASIPAADALFQSYVASGKVSAAVIENERTAVAAAQAACNGPRPSDSKTAALYVQRIMTSVLSSIAQAKRQAGA